MRMSTREIICCDVRRQMDSIVKIGQCRNRLSTRQMRLTAPDIFVSGFWHVLVIARRDRGLVAITRRLGEGEDTPAVVCEVYFALAVRDEQMMRKEEIDSEQQLGITREIPVNDLHFATLNRFCSY